LLRTCSTAWKSPYKEERNAQTSGLQLLTELTLFCGVTTISGWSRHCWKCYSEHRNLVPLSVTKAKGARGLYS